MAVTKKNAQNYLIIKKFDYFCPRTTLLHSWAKNQKFFKQDNWKAREGGTRENDRTAFTPVVVV